MIPLQQKRWIQFERDLSRDRGPFTLFALALRRELANVVSTSDPAVGDGRWDLIVSGPNLYGTTREAYDLTREIKRRLGAKFVYQLARILTLRPTDPLVQAFLRAVPETFHHKFVRLSQTLGGYDYQVAYVIAARPRAASDFIPPPPSPEGVS